MRLFKSIFIVVFLLTLLLGNIGISVYKHSCEEDGVMVSYVFNESEDHCGDHMDNDESCCKSELPSCCEEDEGKNDCCSDDFEYHNIKLDYFNSIDEFDISSVNLSVDQNANYKIVWVETLINQHTFNYENPPPKDPRTIQSEIQVWII